MDNREYLIELRTSTGMTRREFWDSLPDTSGLGTWKPQNAGLSVTADGL